MDADQIAVAGDASQSPLLAKSTWIMISYFQLSSQTSYIDQALVADVLFIVCVNDEVSVENLDSGASFIACPVFGKLTTAVLPVGMFATTCQSLGEFADNVWCQPPIGLHTFWST